MPTFSTQSLSKSTDEYTVTPDLLVGHFRGTIVTEYWICKTEDGRRVRGMANASRRYRIDQDSSPPRHPLSSVSFGGLCTLVSGYIRLNLLPLAR
ncbi:hypothetical protein FIBSPDRAFT_865779 [Athelia psychrophila]|uniref:Uncharacterized protein n=1 Tax=Athelia psychrophila TaxID=1759441 RepID=A0A166FBQ1_9AGAM|nr:hypothetical protein FIBSPDRAFT_865779 [Fibularhizoctonia sp. CBS 109695]